MADYDLILARQLQEEFEKEDASFATSSNRPKHNDRAVNVSHSNTGLSVIDPSWETTDPNPDILALFIQFDRQYFWGKLAGVEVKWSPRMTLCAGVCSYEGRGGLCSIRLSVPLLKLRPRKDLVETLLHEMIHAFLFVTENDRDRDGHGPNFKKHMYRINKASGANITIYHDFHDEVDNYRQHWWRCDGLCRKRPPYYGWVKRAMNRAPSAQDFWWPDHQRSCGGTYTKVKEPEGYGAKKKISKDEKKDSKTEQKNFGKDIRTFWGKGNTLDSSGQNQKSSTSSSTGVIKGSATTTGPASSTVSSKDHSFSSAAGKTFDGKEPTNGKKATLPDSDPQWTVGIWSPEKNSGSSSDFQTSAKPIQKITWMVAETGKDKEGKAESGQGGAAGHVLGNDSSSGLNWLARMRKQWASADRGLDRPSTFSSTQLSMGTSDYSDQQHTGQKTAKPGFNDQTGTHLQPEMPPETSTNHETHKTNTVNSDDHGEAISWSDGSFHDSFHVSSCEEDNWPTPESYKDKTASSCQSKRKRIVLDFSSSDEEHTTSPLVSKCPKVQRKDIVNSDEDDIVLPAVSKNLKLPEKSKLPASNDFNCSESSSDDGHSHDKTVPLSSIKTDLLNEHSHHNGASISYPAISGTTGAFERNSVETSFVDCPSCQKTVLAETINSHLDSCLS